MCKEYSYRDDYYDNYEEGCYQDSHLGSAIHWITTSHLPEVRRRQREAEVRAAVLLYLDMIGPLAIEELHGELPKGALAHEWKRKHRFWDHIFPRWAGEYVSEVLTKIILEEIEEK